MSCDSDAERFRCRVCGAKQDQPPWGEDCESPSHRICSCCGTEFGYEDVTMEAVQMNRRRWVEGGAEWFRPEERPSNWCLEEQLERLPEKWT